MTFKAIIAGFIASLRAGIRKLPLAEQFDANSEARWAISECTSLANRLDVQFAGATDATMAEAVTKQFDAAIQAEAEQIAATAEQAKITAGELIPKAAHDAAISTACEAAKRLEREAVMAEITQKAAVTAERVRLVEEKILPKVVVDKLADTVIVGDQAEALRGKVVDRVGKLTGLGFTPEKNAEHFGNCAIGLDEAGDATFTALIKVASDARASVTAEAVRPPGNPMDQPGGPAKGGVSLEQMI